MSNDFCEHENALLLARMSLERSRQCLAHLQALLYYADDFRSKDEQSASEVDLFQSQIRELVQNMDRELDCNERILDYSNLYHF